MNCPSGFARRLPQFDRFSRLTDAVCFCGERGLAIDPTVGNETIRLRLPDQLLKAAFPRTLCKQRSSGNFALISKARGAALISARQPRFDLLLTDVKLFDDRTISLDILLCEISEKISSVTDDLQKTSAGMMILRVILKMLVKFVDTLGKNGYLNLRRTGISLMSRILLDNFRLSFRQHCVSTSFINIVRR